MGESSAGFAVNRVSKCDVSSRASGGGVYGGAICGNKRSLRMFMLVFVHDMWCDIES